MALIIVTVIILLFLIYYLFYSRSFNLEDKYKRYLREKSTYYRQLKPTQKIKFEKELKHLYQLKNS